MQRSEWERCQSSKATTLDELDVQKTPMIYDWCTDAFIDICFHESPSPVKRLTPHELEDEQDITVGVLERDGFKALALRIHEIAAQKSLDWHMERSALADNDNEYELGYCTSWHSAFYVAAYILKNIDWDNEVIYCSCG